jgi:F-type H+/Na+-transporting ATPase subunit beta
MNASSAGNVGTVASVRGSVVDIQFDTRLPPIYSVLLAKDGKIAIEVLAQVDAHHVRGIALTQQPKGLPAAMQWKTPVDH